MNGRWANEWSFVDAPGEGCLRPGTCSGEPVLVTEDAGRLRVLSNVCTHRGALLVTEPSDARSIRCPYHGRRFDLAGRVLAAPGFEPPPEEPLPELSSFALGPMRFAAGAPEAPMDVMIAPARPALEGLPFEALVHDRTSDAHYDVEAPWSLWAENYLEGLHIPFVHPRLARRLALDAYEVTVHEHCAIQVGMATGDEPTLRLGDGREVAGYYLFVWPFTALNLYPWGISLNAIQPLGEARTRILYRAYEWARELRDEGAGAGLDQVEAEDDAIVERTALGNRARLYRPGRLSEPHERAVQWFRDRQSRPA
ncbi:MAG: Rieske 2Fe-2S domain-containing protein [Myxococcales bacterium]|nr:Rieske 2Fe-2S domain-containing protein [Myxococcales bacterium]